MIHKNHKIVNTEDTLYTLAGLNADLSTTKANIYKQDRCNFPHRSVQALQGTRTC